VKQYYYIIDTSIFEVSKTDGKLYLICAYYKRFIYVYSISIIV